MNRTTQTPANRPWGNAIPTRQETQAVIVPTNPLPANVTPMGQIKQEAQAARAEAGDIAFLTSEAKRLWAERREQFYVTDVVFTGDGRFGPEWTLTLLPFEGPISKISFTSTGGTREEIIARIAENVPVGPCVLTYEVLGNGNGFYSLDEA